MKKAVRHLRWENGGAVFLKFRAKKLHAVSQGRLEGYGESPFEIAH